MPCTGYSPIRAQDSQLQWGSVMGAIRTHGMRLAIDIGQQDFTILNALNLDLAVLPSLQVELGEALDLVFLCHTSG